MAAAFHNGLYSNIRDQGPPRQAPAPWPTHTSPPNSQASPHQPGMYPPANPDDQRFDYAAAAYPPPFPPQSAPSGLPAQPMTLNLAQIDSSIGPSRVLTRRAAKMAQQGKLPSSAPANQQYFAASRSASPAPYHNPAAYSPGIMAAPRSPYYSTAASSGSSSYSPYGFFHTHSRSASGSTSNPRSASPALSAASGLTSASSTSAPTSRIWSGIPPLPTPGGMSPTVARQKHKKQRLFNLDRKAICEFHKSNPNARQEDIAQRYGVERSTISKILKNKTKWLNVPEDENLKVAKHRPSKFPEVEDELVKWLVEVTEAKQVLTDASIRARAKEVARILDIPEDKFKASSGWIENFKHRHGIRRGIWYGDGKNARIARAVGAGAVPEDDSDDEHPRKIMPSVALTDSMGMFRVPPERAGSVAPSTYSADVDMSGEQHEGESLELQHAWHRAPSESPTSAAWQTQPTSADASTSGSQPQAASQLWTSQQEERAAQQSPWQRPVDAPQQQQAPPAIPNWDAPPAEEFATQNMEYGINGPYRPTLSDPLVSTEQPRGVFDGAAPNMTHAEAESLIDRFIGFVDAHPGLLKHEQRLALHGIKVAVFSAQNDAPYAS